MSTSAYLIIGILAVFALAVLFRSGLQKQVSGKTPALAKPPLTARMPASGKSQPPAAKKPAVSRNPYRAASIVAGPNACDAAINLQDKRFLVAAQEVPSLPLPHCDKAKCACKYAHHADRRDDSDADRRGPRGLRSELHAHMGDAERRTKKRGRRTSDWE